MLKQESHFMRFGWRERYESRGSRTVLRGAGVKFPGLLTFKLAKSYINSEKKNREPKVVVKRGVVEIAYDSYKKGKDVALSLLAIKPRLKGLSFKWPFLPHVKVGVKFLPAEYVSNYDTIDDCQRNLERKLRDAYKSL